MTEQYQERQIAVKIKIKDILEGSYVTKEGWEPNYLLTTKGNKISRVNLMGVILDKGENNVVVNLTLDDGSGKIVVRSFEKNKNLDDINIGECVLVIGKIRMFNNEKYVSPEIVKKVEKNWLKLRKLELEKEPDKIEIVKEEVKKKEIEEEFLESISEKVIDLIKGLDQGEGALIEEVKEKLEVENSEEVIESMLKNGEIFQNMSGRVKVL